ncbi:hypothetical protein N7501_008405 [Penicillium viridicatum]|nr:hypothetical protein N7501_008405 [Penicillium viridicatum]
MSPEEIAEVTGRYFLPRNVEEAERMQNQHEWIKGGANGLVLAPIDLQRRGMRVLDAATADGYWMQDVKADFPDDTEFLGFDNAPEGYPPLSTNPPLKIVQQSLIEDFPADWSNAFHFVHQRFVIPLFKAEEVPLVLSNLTGCVKPGGWIQLVEMDFQTPVSEPLESCKAVQTVHKLTSSVVSDPLAATKASGKIVWKWRGARNMLSILGFFQSVAKPEMIGLTEEEWTELPKRFSEEMEKYKFALRVYFVWGQKPEGAQ